MHRFTMWRHSTPAIVVTLILCWVHPVKSANIGGVWYRDGNPQSLRLNLTQKGSKITGQFESSTGDHVWRVSGEINSDGDVELIRLVSFNEWKKTPDSMLSKALLSFGRRGSQQGYFRCPVKLQYDEDEGILTGYYQNFCVRYSTDPLRFIRTYKERERLWLKP